MPGARCYAAPPISAFLDTLLVFINRLWDKIGTYGSPETTPGGRALNFYASIRIDLRQRERLKDGNEYTGNRIRARIVK